MNLSTTAGRRGAFVRVIAGAAVVALAASACSSSKKAAVPQTNSVHSSGANDVNSASVQQGGKVVWGIEKHIDSWNPDSNEGNTFDFQQVFNAIYPNPFLYNPDASVSINSDLLVDAQVTQQEPMTVVYHINPNANWSDGTPINADDFVYNWKAQAGTDQNYDVAGTTGYSQIQNVVGSDNGKTVTVTFQANQPFGDWKSLFGPLVPAHLALKLGATYTGSTAKGDKASFTPEERGWNVGIQNSPLSISGGPYIVDNVSADGLTVTLKPNSSYWGTKYKAKLDQINVVAIEDTTQEISAIKNNELDGIYSQPTQDYVAQAKTLPQGAGANTYTVNEDGGLTYEHIDLNFHNKFLGNATYGKALRQAMFTAFSDKQLISKTVGIFFPTAAQMGNSFLVPGQKGYKDTYTDKGLGSGDVTKAKSILTAAGFKWDAQGNLQAPDGTAIPTLQFKYKGNQTRTDTANFFADQMKQIGINVQVSKSDSLGKLIAQKGDQYQWDIILFAWVNTPFLSGNVSAFQSLPANATDPGNNDGWYSNKDVDAALTEAAKYSSDDQKAIDDYNKASDLIAQDAYTLPLYQKPNIIIYANKIGNVRMNTTSMGPTYNIGEWGLKAS